MKVSPSKLTIVHLVDRQGAKVPLSFMSKVGDLEELDKFLKVICAEVLEHLPTGLLETACKEMMKVSSQ